MTIQAVKQVKPLSKRERLIAEIDELFERIKNERESIKKLEEAFNNELTKLQNKFYPAIEAHKAELKKYEDQLEKLAKMYEAELFKDGDLFETKLGRLIKQVKIAVKKARKVLEMLEKLGWTEAIIVEKKVNWQVLETWPEEKLIACGTERVRKVKITYELFEEKK